MKEKRCAFFLNLSLVVIVISFLIYLPYPILASTETVQCTEGDENNYLFSYPEDVNAQGNWIKLELEFNKGDYDIIIKSNLDYALNMYSFDESGAIYIYDTLPEDNKDTMLHRYSYGREVNRMDKDQGDHKKWEIYVRPWDKEESGEFVITINHVLCPEYEPPLDCKCEVNTQLKEYREPEEYDGQYKFCYSFDEFLLDRNRRTIYVINTAYTEPVTILGGDDNDKNGIPDHWERFPNVDLDECHRVEDDALADCKQHEDQVCR